MKVYLLNNGKFLQFSETSSHSTQRVYSWSAVELAQATVVHEAHLLKRVKWKEPSKQPQVVAEIPAEEVREVKLLETPYN